MIKASPANSKLPYATQPTNPKGAKIKMLIRAELKRGSSFWLRQCQVNTITATDRTTPSITPFSLKKVNGMPDEDQCLPAILAASQPEPK